MIASKSSYAVSENGYMAQQEAKRSANMAIWRMLEADEVAKKAQSINLRKKLAEYQNPD